MKTTTTNLIRTLSRILRSHGLKGEEQKLHLKTITSQFNGQQELKYSLDDRSFLVLSKDVRSMNRLRRYPRSPMPLLSNLEIFSNSLGSWNAELLEYGLKTRYKSGDTPTSSEHSGTNIHLAYYRTFSSQGNQYLKRQYKRLRTLRDKKLYASYWKLGWTLMSKSLVYRVASLNSWQPRWYKEMSSSDLSSIFQSLHQILSLEQLQMTIKNVWIESPRGKWRQLCIPPKGWRLYFHMLNMLISYLYEPSLSPEEYDGFIYNRGCKSWWENLLWGPDLDQYPHIMEADLSSGFPNLSRIILSRCLKAEGKIPPSYVNLIMTHLCSPLREALWFPTFETFAENHCNKSWRHGNRSVPMGIGISPILFVICVNWVVKRLKLTNTNFKFKWYADDITLLFSLRGLKTLLNQTQRNVFWILKEVICGRNLILSTLNSLPLFRAAGLRLCPNKSRVIRFFRIWLHDLKSLGLKLYTEESILSQIWTQSLGRSIPMQLQGNTRGRGINLLTGHPGTQGSRSKLNYEHLQTNERLDYSRMKTDYRQYFGLLMSNLYASPKNPSFEAPPEQQPLKFTILKRVQKYLKKYPHKTPEFKLNQYNLGSKLSELLLQVNCKDPHASLNPNYLIMHRNIERGLQIPWSPIETSPSTKEVGDPLAGQRISHTDYFYKYSELKLEGAALLELKAQYLNSKASKS